MSYYCASCGKPIEVDATSCQACGRPVTEKPARKSKWGVIAIVGCAVAVGALFFAGIIAAIAIPNLLNAIDRGKQKRTMADIRSIATAVEAYGTETGAIPVASGIDELAAELQPTYIRVCPRVDGWGHAMQYEISEEGSYSLWSAGKDGVPESVFQGGPTRDFDCDIVFSDGEFVQWPEGMQR